VKPEETKAIVYVFQEEKNDPNVWNFGHATIRIGVDGTWTGATYGDSYFFFSVDPGDHHLMHQLAIKFQSSFQVRVGSQFHG